MLHGLDYNVSVDTDCDVGLGIGLGTESTRWKKLYFLQNTKLIVI